MKKESKESNYEPYQNNIICQHKFSTGYQTFPYHRHNGYEIYLFLQGNVYFYLDSNCYEVSSGDLILIPASVMHRIVSIDEQIYERITVNVKQTVLDQLSTSSTNLAVCFFSSQTSTPRPIHLTQKEIQLFIQLTDELSDFLHSDNYGSDIQVNICMSRLLLFLNQCEYNNHSLHANIMPALVKNVMVYIQNHLAEDLSLNTLSRQFYHNGTYISRCLKKHIGLSVQEYVLDCRIELAKKILLERSSVSEACYRSGFRDYSNFIRTFTKKTGISPGHYSKK